MNVLSHRGYHAAVAFDPDDMLFTGRVGGIRDIVGFHGATVEELVTAFREAVDDYLETCRVAGKSPDKPYSGKIMLRVAPQLHAKASLAAELSGMSLNQWGEKVLAEALAAS